MLNVMANFSFDIVRLLRTVFHPQPGERVGVFIDLPEPQAVVNWKFLQNPTPTHQIAYEVFYKGLQERKSELQLASVEFFAYEPTGGSNLDLPATVVSAEGKTQRLIEDTLSRLNIVLY